MTRRDYDWEKARTMASAGHTAREIADALGIAASGDLRKMAAGRGIYIRRLDTQEFANRMAETLSKAWTPEREAELKRLWLLRPMISCTEIAKRMQVSKGTVTGKVHRMGLPLRPSPVCPHGRRRKRVPRKGESGLPPQPSPMALRRAEMIQVPRLKGPVLPAIRALLEAA